MTSIERDKIDSDGGEHSIRIGVRFEDQETPDYEHSVVWRFSPTFATDSQTPCLEITGFLHKKYWHKIDADLTLSTTDDGSEIVFARGWVDSPFDPTQLPKQVEEKLSEIFGKELAENTVSKADSIFGCELTEVQLPDIPETADCIVPEFRVEVMGRYTEEIPESDSRVTEDDFTSKVKDAETGEVLSVYHSVSHSFSWWFTPKENEFGVQVEKYLHKTWDDGMTGGFETKYENEEIVEGYKTPEESPDLSDAPDEILTSLIEWFGEPFVKTLLEDTGREMPTYAYECFECNSVFEVTPRSFCPSCGSESLCRYESLEAYYEAMEEETEFDKKVKEDLASRSVVVSSEDEC